MAETLTVGHGLRKYDAGDNPGANNLNLNWDQVDKRLLGLGSAFPSSYPVTGLFLRTDEDKLYENTGTLGAPVWTLRLDGSGGAAANFADEELTVASNGQTVFALALPYLPGSLVVLAVNGIQYKRGTSYTIAGTVLTWLNNPFTLSLGEKVLVTYGTP